MLCDVGILFFVEGARVAILILVVGVSFGHVKV